MHFWNHRSNKERQSDGEKEREAFFINENWPEILQERGGGERDWKMELGAEAKGEGIL